MKRIALIISVLSLLIICSNANASKLAWMKAIDKDYLMFYFFDGDVCFADNNPSYNENQYSGCNWVLSYGSALNTTNATTTSNWLVTSADDAHYTSGLSPTNCYRRTKINGMSEDSWNSSANDWNCSYTYEHTIYLKLPYSMVQGNSYTIQINSNTNSDTTSKTLTFDIFNSRSEAIHVNLVGYMNDSGTKAADLYLWLGDGGFVNFSGFVGNNVYIYDVNTSASQQVGNVAFWKSNGTHDAGGFNLTASDVWKADFTGFNTPGTYRIAIDGVGCSEDFVIAKNAYFEPFKLTALGYFYQLCGKQTYYAGMPPTRRPLYIPHVSPSSTIVYITTTTSVNFDDTSTWANYRPPGNPQNNNATGGFADAWDWDRNLTHCSIIPDMLLPYILTDGRLNDDNLQMGDSGNGIPDVLDNAKNEVDFWLSLRYNGGYGYGVSNPNSSNVLYQAGIIPLAAWASATNASMLAYCYQITGMNDLKDTYTAAAVEAYNYGCSVDTSLTSTIGIGQETARAKDLKMTAAAFLYNLTGDTTYENTLNSLISSEITSGASTIDSKTVKHMLWACVGYLKTKQPVHYSTLFSNMKPKTRKQITAAPARRAGAQTATTA